MAAPRNSIRARVILQAVKLSSDAQIPSIRQLIVRHPDILKLELVLRILLTYLPESIEPESYLDLLRYLVQDDVGATVSNTQDSSELEYEFSDFEARERVRQLHLLPLAPLQHSDDKSVDAFTLFLLHRAFRIDAETGSIPLVAQLVEPFLGHSRYLRTWAVSILLPLLRLDYVYYPSDGPTYSLETFEKLNGNAGVQSLLSKAAQAKTEGSKTEVGRDIRGLVGPWICGQNLNKRRKMESSSWRRSSIGAQTVGKPNATDDELFTTGSWSDVNEWLLELAIRDYAQAVQVVEQWDGPKDLDYGDWSDNSEELDNEASQVLQIQYGQAALSTIYATKSATLDTVVGSHRILRKISELPNLRLPPDLDNLDVNMVDEISHEYLGSLSSSHLLHNALLRAHNPLTSPMIPAVSLLFFVLASSHILQSHDFSKSCRDLLDLAVFAGEGDQLTELRRLLHTIQSTGRSQPSWDSIRHQVLWLHDWAYQASDSKSRASVQPRGLFCKVQLAAIENELLKAMLASSYYDIAGDIYCKLPNPPLSPMAVEKTVVEVALAAFDSTSNGNRNRRSVRKTAEIISAFRTFFPDSQALERIDALLAATHSMSFYSLTLQHGVPFQPVNIRAHKDPMSLIGKILEQNARSYTKLDDLLDIGQNLVAAGLMSAFSQNNDESNVGNSASYAEKDSEGQALLAQRRITGMAIEAALRENDFDTAYSYVVNRLSPPTVSFSSDDPPSDGYDNISWRAAYLAGLYNPTSQPSEPSALRRLEQRMELLSQALLLAPPASLPEILTVWRRCEVDLNIVFAREAAEEEKWNKKGDRHIPGGFSRESVPTVQKSRESSRAAMSEEAPMGLFDVARGAASALSKNAFPLRSPRFSGGSGGSLQSPHERSLSKMGSGASDSGSGAEGSEGRVRKRDMVSNMVTGGLASGIGWVIGAPPVKSDHDD